MWRPSNVEKEMSNASARFKVNPDDSSKVKYSHQVEKLQANRPRSSKVMTRPSQGVFARGPPCPALFLPNSLHSRTFALFRRFSFQSPTTQNTQSDQIWLKRFAPKFDSKSCTRSWWQDIELRERTLHVDVSHPISRRADVLIAVCQSLRRIARIFDRNG